MTRTEERRLVAALRRAAKECRAHVLQSNVTATGAARIDGRADGIEDAIAIVQRVAERGRG